MKKKYKKVSIWISIILIAVISVFLYIKLMNVQNMATFKSWFEPSFKGYFLYIILVILQILIIPISTMVIIVPALILYGPWTTFLLTLLGLTIGSILAYYVGFFSSNWANKLLSKNPLFDKWNKELQKNGKILLPYFCIIPIFPDEIICILAGIAKINIWYYTIVTILTRGLHLIFICFLGAIVPMHGWWLVLWLVIFLIISIFCIYLTKKQESIKNWFLKIFAKK